MLSRVKMHYSDRSDLPPESSVVYETLFQHSFVTLSLNVLMAPYVLSRGIFAAICASFGVANAGSTTYM